MNNNTVQTSLLIEEPNLLIMPDLSSENNIIQLKIYKTKLQYLDGNLLPKTLITLICEDNEIMNVYNLPKSIKYLNLSFNKIQNIDNLPPNLETFIISNNNLTNLPNLPNTIKFLAFGYNQLTKINKLHDNLQELHCYYNLLNELTNIPQKLKSLQCYGNNLAWLPYIPESVIRFNCHFNDFPDLIKIQKTDLCKKQFINYIYNFRLLFYSLKYKNKFIEWVQKIKKNKQPNYCCKIL